MSAAVVAKTKSLGWAGDDVGADGVDHLQGAVGGVVVLDVVGVDEDGEELCAEEAFHAGEVGLAGLVGGGDVVAVDGLARGRRRGCR